MKKIFLSLAFCLLFLSTNSANAHHCHSYAYVTYRDYYREDLVFHNCNKHSVLKETYVYYYSNGTRRTNVVNTIFNNDGSVLVSNCSDVKHFLYNGKHYFSFYKNKKYQIIDEFGEPLTVKNFKMMKEVFPNKFLVKLEKKYGIIDLFENTIVPIKYNKFEQVGKDLFLTKLNGYWGLIDSSGKVFVKNENDKIKQIYNVFILKKDDKYGLANLNGEIVLSTDYDKIEALGEYIVVKKDKKYGVYDSNGNKLTDIIYKKIRLNRNNLEVLQEKNWIELF